MFAPSLESHIRANSNNSIGFSDCYQHFIEGYRPILAKSANKKSWFKDIEPAEKIARHIVGPNYDQFTDALKGPINQLFQWAQQE